MAFFEHDTPVRYVCTCGEVKPLARVYFCRHCSEIRCGFCVCHEVDARYCPACMENLPAAEAWMKKNCCATCYICPVCQHGLIRRMTSVQAKKDKAEIPAPGEKDEGKKEKPEPPKKMHYLCCFLCHWTTRDVGMEDQSNPSGSWSDGEAPHAARIAVLVEFWKAISLTDRLAKEKKQPLPRRGYTHLSGMSAAMTRRKAGLSSLSPFALGGLQELRKPPVIEPSVAVSDLNDLPADIFTAVPDLNQVTTLAQRFGSPECQVLTSANQRPARRLLYTKRTQRCRQCEHNVTKPEYYPTSIKFKIQLSAFYHIPEVHIRSCEPLRSAAESNIVLKLVNPTSNPTTVTFLPVDCEEETQEKPSEQRAPPSRPLPLLTATPLLPSAPLILPGRDDAAEYDDTTENQNFTDDPKVVVWRKANKAAVRFGIRPQADLLPGTDVVFAFTLCHTYTNTIIQQKINHKVKIIISPGKIVQE